MAGDSDSEDAPLTRRSAREGDPASDPAESSATDGEEGELVQDEIPSVAPALPLSDASFPAFDSGRIPPRPPMPVTPLTGESSIIREQWRARRGEFESHVAQAREQFDQTNARIKQRTGRDLIVAILIGVGFGAVLIASLLFIKWLFIPIAVAAGLLGTYELSRALRVGGRRVDVVPQLIAGSAVMLTGPFAALWLSWVVLIAAVAFVAVWRMIAQMIAGDGRTYGAVLGDVVVGAFIQVYVPFLTSVALMLLSREHGEWWVLSFVAVAVVADTCAYAAGLSFGRHPMVPRISPKKTWEGFAGAVSGSLAVGVVLALFVLQLPWWCGLVFGAAIVACATLGDLGESMLKRDLGIKDMSSWLPGHGGLLDRLDSILPSTIAAFALYHLFAPLIGS